MVRLATAFSLSVAAVLVLAARSASAQGGLAEGLKTTVDTSVSSITSTLTDTSGVATTTSSTSFYPRLTINSETLLYPNLRLNAGGMFDVNVSSFTNPSVAGARDFETTTTLLRLRPFFELRSTNPTLAPGISYHRRESRDRTTGAAFRTLVSEDYAAYLGWKPEALPQAEFQVIRTNTFDATRASQDDSKDFGSVLSRYTFKGMNVSYRGSYLGTDDRIRRVETRQVSNAGRLAHSGAFLRRRLQWSGTYNVDRQDLRTTASGEGGEVALPVIPFSGLALLSDVPVTTALPANPLLIDGNLTAGAGINLGVPGLGADAQARNIGLDFVSPTGVNTLKVWVDRELPANIASAFSWEVYSSADNVTWRRETVVSAAPFGPFENRFLVEFRSVTARYIKTVTRPLSAAVIDASRFPEIFVTEMEAFLTQSAQDARGALVRTTQNLNADVRLRILNTPTLYYEGSYWRTDVPLGPARRVLSNGVSVNHRFSRLFAATGRAAREQGTQAEGRRTANVTNATLTVDPVHTLTTSLLYTGISEQIAGRPNDRNGISLQTNAQLYRGVALQGGVGWNFTTRDTGERLRDRFFNVSGSIVPRQNLTLTVSYADTRTRRSGVFVGDPRFETRSGFATLAFDPVPTLHVVLGEEILAIAGEKTRNTHNIGINWAPFRDGSLQFILAYNEYLRPLEFGSERIFRPGVRWIFARQSFIEMSYQRIQSEQFVQRIRTRIFSVDLKLFL